MALSKKSVSIKLLYRSQLRTHDSYKLAPESRKSHSRQSRRRSCRSTRDAHYRTARPLEAVRSLHIRSNRQHVDWVPVADIGFRCARYVHFGAKRHNRARAQAIYSNQKIVD